LTNVRLVWHANLAENFNVSIPYIQVFLPHPCSRLNISLDLFPPPSRCCSRSHAHGCFDLLVGHGALLDLGMPIRVRMSASVSR
jgi:hypothetical protein